MTQLADVGQPLRSATPHSSGEWSGPTMAEVKAGHVEGLGTAALGFAVTTFKKDHFITFFLIFIFPSLTEIELVHNV